MIPISPILEESTANSGGGVNGPRRCSLALWVAGEIYDYENEKEALSQRDPN